MEQIAADPNRLDRTMTRMTGARSLIHGLTYRLVLSSGTSVSGRVLSADYEMVFLQPIHSREGVAPLNTATICVFRDKIAYYQEIPD